MRSILTRCSAVALGLSAAALVAAPLGCDRALPSPIPSAHGDDATPRRGGTLHLASLGDIRSAIDPATGSDARDRSRAPRLRGARRLRRARPRRARAGRPLGRRGRRADVPLRPARRRLDARRQRADRRRREALGRARAPPDDSRPERQRLREPRRLRGVLHRQGGAPRGRDRRRPVRGRLPPDQAGRDVSLPPRDAHAAPDVQERGRPLLRDLARLRSRAFHAPSGRLAARDQPAPRTPRRLLPPGPALPRCGRVDVQHAGARAAGALRARGARSGARPSGRGREPLHGGSSMEGARRGRGGRDHLGSSR